MNTFKKSFNQCGILLISLLLLTISGCSALGGASKSDDGKVAADSSQAINQNQPYYPTEFKDLLIPGELQWNREKTMSIRTDSFAGGILNFSGRVEANSLSDFFVTTMQKNGWKLTGTVKYKDILLAFTKPRKTSMFKISEGGFGTSTEVYIYITYDIDSSTSAK